MLNTRTANLLGFLACAGLMAYALYAEYVLYLEPCPLCIFQRFGVIAMLELRLEVRAFIVKLVEPFLN
ncbi:MAG: disulfide bond formation protein B, partial [Pseudomonadota bacterium]